MYRFLKTLAGVLLLLALTLPTQPVRAATTWTVNTLEDQNDNCTAPSKCSLREAVTLAASGDTIEFIFGLRGTITLTQGEIVLEKDLTITGPDDSIITVSGNSSSRVFKVNVDKTVSISGLKIANGSAGSGEPGGGIKNYGTLTVTNCTFTNNHTVSNQLGGGIDNEAAGVLTVSNSIFDANSAGFGGAINNDGTASITSSTFTDNSAVSAGGAVHNTKQLTLNNSTFTTNTAPAGGAIALVTATIVTIDNSTFDENSATTSSGGAVYTNNTYLTITNSTFVYNSAAQKGGGVFQFKENLYLVNNTFSWNSAAGTSGAGVHIDYQATLHYYNNILANKSSGLDCANNGFETTVTDKSNNLAESGNCGADFSADPKLGSLADNGGPTETLRLLSGSPAINAGDASNCPEKDQRGVDRTTCDIGAFELDIANRTPTDLALSASSILENQPSATAVGTLTTTDPDGGDLHTYSFCGGTDDASFQIGGTQGDELQTAAVFDFETKSSYSICIRTTDFGGLTLDETFPITVTDANEPPTDITLSNNTVDESLPAGTLVGNLSTTDSNPGDTHTYSLACTVPGANDASFSIVGTALNTAAVFDYETKNTYAICLRSNDGNGGTFDKAFTINITNTFETLTATLRSVGAQDGWVLESSESSKKGGTLDSVATTLRLGDDNAKKQYRSILSFETGATLPDNAVITKVTLKVKKHSITGGGNPVAAFQGFIADIKKGFLGTTALQTTDFQTAANKTVGPFVTAINGGWYSIDLTSGKGYINKLSSLSGLTQVRLRFNLDDNNNAAANYLSLFSGNAPAASRPQLIIEYHLP